ncbi:MAG: hypothetical protein IJ599_02730 [Alphaproteobacteria bacterium]|nr:hypothetical protein [Alphaproteobacteria bacterium]
MEIKIEITSTYNYRKCPQKLSSFLKFQAFRIILFPKRDEKKRLICRAAVKPAGRSPKSKPEGAAWLDGSTKGKSV